MAGVCYPVFAALLIITSQCSNSNAARILGVFPWPGTSHMITFSALTHALAERGHELVVLSTFPSKNPPNNYTDIDTSGVLKEMYEKLLQSSDIYDFEDTPKIFLPLFYWQEGINTVNLTLRDQKAKNLLKDKRGFDLVISEDFMCDAVFGFAHYFKVKL
jgi:glucuronosyltransferase